MQQQKRAGTQPEMAVRRAVHRRGLRYYVNRRPIAGLRRMADLVFPTAKVAVFVDGCFWHGCSEHGPSDLRENTWYWPEKIASNQRRDRDTDARLLQVGWLPLRFWEHHDPDTVAREIERAVRSRSVHE
jgi:DNA mismatch endonuclease, patch repair protein